MRHCFLLAVCCFLFCNGVCSESTPANPYIAIIESKTGSGTGFLMVDNGEIWLYTNEHVIRGGRPISARLLTGEKLTLGELQISMDRDAARFKIEGKTSGLRLIAEQPAIGDSVKVYGNSDGAGVGTYLEGRILGVGPVDVEVSALFVPGNSGSPIIVVDKGVVGIATYLINGDPDSDWTIRGTRFAQVRRFGIRLDTAAWADVNVKEYFNGASTIRSARKLGLLLEKVCFSKSWIIDTDPEMITKQGIDNSTMRLWVQKIQRHDREMCETYDKMREAKMIAEGKDRESYYSYNDIERNLREKRFEHKYRQEDSRLDRKIKEAYAIRAKTLKETYYLLKKFNSSVPRLQNLASLYASQLRKMYNDYLEIHSRDLRQMNKL